MDKKVHHLSFASKNFLILFSGLLLLHGLFFLFAYRAGNIYLTVDSTEYLNQADNIKYHASWYAGKWDQPHDDFLETRRPPLYASFLFLVKSVVDNDYFVLALQNLISIFCLLLAYYLAQFIANKEINPFYFLMPLLFFATQFIYANMIMADVLFQLCLMSAVFFFYRFAVNGKAHGFLWFNIMIALAILTKPVMYLFWVVIAVVTLLLYAKNNLKLKNTFYSAIPFAVVMLLSFYNYRQTGLFHYSSVNQKFISEYGAYLSVGERGNEVAQNKIDSLLAVAKAQPDFKSYSTYLDEESETLIKQNFGRFVMAQTKGMLQFFIDHGRWDLYAFFINPDYVQKKGIQYYFRQDGLTGVFIYLKTFNLLLLVYLIFTTAVNIFLAYTLFRFFLRTRTNYVLRLMIACLIFYQAIFTSVVGCSRYRMAIYPMLLIATGIFLADRDSMKKVKA